MRTHRFATIAAASAVALLALGGTAFALGADDIPPAPATSGATPAGVEREVEHGTVEWKAEVHRSTTAPEVHRSSTPTRAAVPAPSSGTGHRSDDDHGSGRHGSDDGPGHDAGDDHGRHGG